MRSSKQDSNRSDNNQIFLDQNAHLRGVIPEKWSGIVSNVQDFFDASIDYQNQKCAGQSTAETELTLKRIHDDLIQEQDLLLEPNIVEPLDIQGMNFVFAKALLLQSALRFNLAEEDLYLDTAGSKTLHKFRSEYIGDYTSNKNDIYYLREYARDYLGLSREDLDRLDDEITQANVDVDKKKSIVKSLFKNFGLSKDGQDLDVKALNLFKMLYSNVELEPSEVKVVLTSTLVFFCLPLDADGNFDNPRYRSLEQASEKSGIDHFISRLRDIGEESQFENFPAFGFIDEDDVNEELIDRVAKDANLSKEELFSALRTMVTILPQDQIDKFLVHDVWGHGWQGTMLDFNKLYISLSNYLQPLRLSEVGHSQTLGKIRFADCFRGKGESLKLDKEDFKNFVRAELEERLPIAMTPVFAEMMADIIEYKFLEDNPDLCPDMESSSFFKDFPTKLDLSITDVPKLFKQATHVFSTWVDSTEMQSNTSQEIMDEFNTSKENADKAIEVARQAWKELEAFEYSDQISSNYKTGSSELEINMITRWFINTVSIHIAVSNIYPKLSELDTGDLPLRSFKKLLTLAPSVFYEQNPRANAWKIDEFISNWFIPLAENLVKSRRS